MFYIQNQHNTFSKVIPQQSLAGDKQFRLLNCCLAVNADDGILLYNTLSCELVFLNKQEKESLYSNEYLVRHWFIVPEDFDDRKFIGQSLGIIKMLSTARRLRYNFTIFTTTDCNARCFYCFQKGIHHISMTTHTADKIVDYILHEYETHLKKQGQQLLLQWFGGEPLYNHTIITHICKRLTDAGADFRSSTISNGYLFTPEIAKEAHDLWHLKKVQITIDGTQKVYNRVKNFIYNDTDAFHRVLDNIDSLLEQGIKVTVRLNTDAYNADNLMQLAEELGQRYAGKENFSCYARPLFENDDRKETVRSDERRTLVYAKLKELEKKLRKQHIGTVAALPKTPRLVFCKADADNGFTFLPDGRMGLCDFYTESNFVSHIDNPTVIDTAIAKRFKEHCDDLPICDDCPLYPQCIRLKMCGEENCCFPQMKEHHIQRMKLSMLFRYKKWLKHPGEVTTDSAQDADEDNYSETVNC